MGDNCDKLCVSKREWVFVCVGRLPVRVSVCVSREVSCVGAVSKERLFNLQRGECDRPGVSFLLQVM